MLISDIDFIKYQGQTYLNKQQIINYLSLILNKENSIVIKDLIRKLLVGLIESKP